MHPIITIFCAFTRRWALERWLDNLKSVQHDPALTNLCIIVDMDDPYILKVFKAFAEEQGYRSLKMRINEDWNPNEVRISVRRQRVAEIKNQSKELIAQMDGEIILGFEDDTAFDRLESFEPLITPLLQDTAIGFVEGVQMGRWGVNVIGAWLADDPKKPHHIRTLLPPTNESPSMPLAYPFQGITGGGFYGYATRRQLYLDYDYYWATSQPWGPDVNYGIWLNQHGYKCLINWSVIFGHNDHNEVRYPDDLPRGERLAEIAFNRDDTSSKWERTDNEPNRY